jgi:hypothetical protein
LDKSLIRQIRILQVAVCGLLLVTGALCVNLLFPFLPAHFRTLDAGQIRIREADGTLKAMLSNSAGFSGVGESRKQQPVEFSGLMFYNQEGEEEGGLVYRGKAIPGGQDADVSLTFDQYRQDQDVYLHHEEYKAGDALNIDDGLTVLSRPDHTRVKEEYAIYGVMDGMKPADRDALRLKSLQEGKIGTRRLFVGDKRGSQSGVPYDDAGIFIKNRWGQDAIRLYVDYDNRPHFEVFDAYGKSKVYELKLEK